jgi:predicted ATPase
MHIANVYVRFFRSFNYDYLRKTHPGAGESAWEQWHGGGWYPFVDVPLEPGITTVVGANESGKSQLLGAIERALTGDDIRRGDFCRHSEFFAVDASMSVPEFGLRLSGLDTGERAAFAKAVKGGLPEVGSLVVIRGQKNNAHIFVETAEGWQSYAVTNQAALKAAMPSYFKIDADIPLPTSVPIQYLSTGKLAGVRTRDTRHKWMERLFDKTATGAKAAAARLAEAQSLVDELDAEPGPDPSTAKQMELADDLLVRVAGITREAFSELAQAVAKGQEGYANGLIDQINAELSKALNFTKYWSQDRDFQLKLTLRDRDVVFTVKDRTGTEYSFNERSGGLKYFLSYLVQYLRHDFTPGRPQVLLMDEPDAYLSSTGQRDLLRIFEGFAAPENPAHQGCQVVYVTHSPFLIDKNHEERIRVLQKGQDDEGTRVVQDVARNHYEPLRSAFGGFAAETAFIGNCNIFVEGPSDQVLLAGMSAWLRRGYSGQIDNLDLNNVTLVPAAGTGNIPYVVYLARGRGSDRPAVVVLLDSDEAGDIARKALAKGGPRGKQLVDPKYVFQLGDLDPDELSVDTSDGVIGIEDLVPASLALAAGRRYVAEFLGAEAAARLDGLTPASLAPHPKGMHAAAEVALAGPLGDGFHLDKVGFARSVIDALPGQDPAVVARIEQNFRCLFRELGARQRTADREQLAERTTDRVKRELAGFRVNHPTTATKERAQVLIENLDRHLDQSPYSDDLRLRLNIISKAHGLRIDPTTPVEDLDQFVADLTALAYQEIRESALAPPPPDASPAGSTAATDSANVPA